MTSRNKKRVRYAVVGLGNIAQVAVLPAFEHADDVAELAALISSDPRKLELLGKKYDVPQSMRGDYDDLERVIAEGKIDAVYIALPNTFHRVFTERVAAAGAHVLCEKPMAMTERDCQAMIDTTRAHGVKLMIAYRLHFESGNLDVIERVRRGDIGEPRIFSSVFCHQVKPGDIRTRDDVGGGALFDLGIYCLNAARYVFQAEPTEVYATQVRGRDERSEDVDELTSAIFVFPNQCIAQFTASQGAADVDEFRIVGSKGTILLEPAFEYAGPVEETITIHGKEKTKSYPQRDQFAPELIHFSRCILDDTDPEPSGKQGLADVRIMEAMRESARSGRRIAVAPVQLDARPDKRLEMKRPPTRKIQPVHAPSPSK